MATIMTPTAPVKPHTHLEIHALTDGGYVVREARFNQHEDGNDPRHWLPRWELAAFTTLREAVLWVEAKMVNKSSSQRGR
jgi:hypothetical protein